MKKTDNILNPEDARESETKTTTSSMEYYSRSVDFEAKETDTLMECFGKYVKSGMNGVSDEAEVNDVLDGVEVDNGLIDLQEWGTEQGKMSAKSLEDVLVRCTDGDEKAMGELRDFVEWGSIYCVRRMRLWKVISDFVAENSPKKEMTPEVRRAAQALKTAYARFSVYAFLVGFVDALKEIGKRNDVDDIEKCIDDLFKELDARGNESTMTSSNDLAGLDDEVDADIDVQLCDEIVEEWSGHVDQYGYITL